MAEQPVTMGRIVRYVMTHREAPAVIEGERIRAAIVVWAEPDDSGRCDLHVYLREHDNFHSERGFMGRRGVPYDAEMKEGTWHWPAMPQQAAAAPPTGGERMMH